MSRRFPGAGLLALAALALPACGGDDEQHYFPVHPTSGRVVSGGKPVPRAIVRFHPVDPSALAVPEGKDGPAVMLTTETDAEGAFTLSTYLADDGVPAGDYAVTVAAESVPEQDVENSDGPNRRPARPAVSPAVARKYRDPATTPLKATVEPGGENRFEFTLD